MGYTPDEFYDMTHKEFLLALEGYSDRIKDERRANAELVTMMYNNIQVQLKGGQFKTAADIYPDLFNKQPKEELSNEEHNLIKGFLQRCN